MSLSSERILADLVDHVDARYYGKYRGVVVDNADPEQLGRLRVRVPSVLGPDVVTGWAMPCVPYGGDDNQGFLFIPEPEAGVWIEFEEGDLEFPVWVGTYWSRPGSTGEMPKPNDPDGAEQGSVQDPPSRKIIKTKKGHSLQFEDADGSELVILVDGAHGHVVTLDASGIVISDGVNVGNTITLDASGVVVADKNGNNVVLGPAGIQIGTSSAAEPLVLGTTLKMNVVSFLTTLNTHTHVGNLGAPTSPPVAPMQLDVPLSPKHKTE